MRDDELVWMRPRVLLSGFPVVHAWGSQIPAKINRNGIFDHDEEAHFLTTGKVFFLPHKVRRCSNEMNTDML